jgi:hypothetical protein
MRFQLLITFLLSILTANASSADTWLCISEKQVAIGDKDGVVKATALDIDTEYVIDESGFRRVGEQPIDAMNCRKVNNHPYCDAKDAGVITFSINSNNIFTYQTLLSVKGWLFRVIEMGSCRPL